MLFADRRPAIVCPGQKRTSAELSRLKSFGWFSAAICYNPEL